MQLVAKDYNLAKELLTNYICFKLPIYLLAVIVNLHILAYMNFKISSDASTSINIFPAKFSLRKRKRCVIAVISSSLSFLLCSSVGK